MITNLAESNRKIKYGITGIDFMMNLYGSLTESEINKIPEESIPKFIAPIEETIHFGSYFYDIEKEIKNKFENYITMIDSSTGLVNYSSNDISSSFISVGIDSDIELDKRIKIIQKYTEELKVNEEILYIAHGHELMQRVFH